MKIKKLDFPAPIFVIDDFLSDENAKLILKECHDLTPHYQEAQVHLDGKIQKTSNRKNDVLYIDEFFNGRRTHSDIITCLERKLFKDEEMQKFWREGRSILSVVPHSTINETVLSRYGNCDFYGWHTDNGIDVPCKRLVTVVYYVNTEPEKFTGGELMLKEPGKDGEKDFDIKVKPKHNRAVIFPSDTLHKVNNVRMKSEDLKDFRYSLNLWIGFRA